MIVLPLSQGLNAVIDDCDAGLASIKWSAHRQLDSKRIYAVRSKFEMPDGSLRFMSLHRAIFGITDPKIFVDHLDGNGLDCRRSNMELKDNTRNQWNREGPMTNKRKDTPLGVYAYRGRWRAMIHAHGVKHVLGVFETIDEAQAARLEGERRIWGIQPRRAHLHV